MHEYHCIAIRMRCWLVDVLFYSLLQCWQHICASRIDHVHRARETNDYQQSGLIGYMNKVLYILFERIIDTTHWRDDLGRGL